MKLALAMRENEIRAVSLYEFYCKYYYQGKRLCKRSSSVALEVRPNFSADCAAVDHGLHQAYAQRTVVAFWPQIFDSYRLA